jgi:hypothetical protein
MEYGNLREAIQYLVGLGEEGAEPKVIEIGGKTYCNKNLNRYAREDMAEPIKATSLTAMVDYIKSNREELKPNMIIHVVSPDKVVLMSGLNNERNREYLFESYTNKNGFQFDYYYDQEDFIINMQTAFKETEDLKIILQVAGNVENNATANYGDDGISQKTTIKKGIASKVDVKVPNPVKLAPYRTFLEVPQPESEFVFRISEDRAGAPTFKLVGADGGLWKYEAVDCIKEYLENQLGDMEGITIIG